MWKYYYHALHCIWFDALTYESIKSYWAGGNISSCCASLFAWDYYHSVKTTFSGWTWLSRWPKTKDKHLSRVGSNGSRWRLFLDVRDTVVSCPTRSSTERRGTAMYQGHWDWARPSIGHHWSSVVGPVTNIMSIIVYFADIYILDQLWALGKGHEVDPGQ